MRIPGITRALPIMHQHLPKVMFYKTVTTVRSVSSIAPLHVYSSNGDKEEDQALLAPINYIYEARTKDIRFKFNHAFNYWLKVPQNKLNEIQDAIQIIYNACLMLDDIQDCAALRAKVPAAHHLYEKGATINSACYAMHITYERINALNHPKALHVFFDVMNTLYRGQGMDIYWRDNYICPTETEYKKVVNEKNILLVNSVVRLLQLFSNCKEDLAPLIKIINIYFQIHNDYFNLYRKEYTPDTDFGDDISSGTFSFPIIHAIRNHPKDQQIINILRRRTKDFTIKRHCIKLLEQFGSFDYTRAILEEMDKQIREEIQRLGGNPLLVKCMDDLLNWKIVKHSVPKQENDLLIH